MIPLLNALLVLGDHQLAMQEVQKGLDLYPNSKEIRYMGVKIFARGGSIEPMMHQFRSFQLLSKEDAWPRDILEEMAWGIIEKGVKGGAPLTRAIALIAASIGNDARGVEILRANSADSHRLIRRLVVEFASHFRDESLQEMIKERLKVEKDPEVRIALIGAIGKMLIVDLEDKLLTLLENDRSSAEEKAAAIASLLDLKDSVDPAEIEKLVRSDRAALRHLAAELMRVQDKQEAIPLLLPLLKDTHSEVRKSALEALGALRASVDVSTLLKDPVAEVALTAAFVRTLQNPEEGQQELKKWLESPHAEERLYAAAILKGTGKYGYPLNLNAFKETLDPYVKLNLAIALIQEQIDPQLGSSGIYDIIMNYKERLMEWEWGHFSAIGPCQVNHRPDIPHYPEAVNQMTRLELLNLLAIQAHPQALEAIATFLKERPWGVTGAASALLLTEGEEEALLLIRKLLNDESEKVQLQAALILAVWGNDREALSTLQRLYPNVSSSKKEQIIEALGKIGDYESIPFLVERLEESKEHLRMIAASAILQVLYH